MPIAQQLHEHLREPVFHVDNDKDAHEIATFYEDIVVAMKEVEGIERSGMTVHYVSNEHRTHWVVVSRTWSSKECPSGRWRAVYLPKLKTIEDVHLFLAGWPQLPPTP